MQFRFRLLASASLIALAAAAPQVTWAADPSSGASLPAVSGPNGKIGSFAGSADGDFLTGISGSWAVPLDHQWGAQLDGMAGLSDSAPFYGIGAHLFWRDPSKGLVGLTGSWVGWSKSTTEVLPLGIDDDTNQLRDVNGANVGRVGVEAAAYLGRLTLEGAAGYQFGDNAGVDGRATIAFYPTDDLRLALGVSDGAGAGATFRGGAEWAPEGHNLSFFANAAAASSDSWSAVGGIKVYFGGAQKSLIRRHREDDPDNLLPDDLYGIVGDNYCPVGYRMINGFCDSNS